MSFRSKTIRSQYISSFILASPIVGLICATSLVTFYVCHAVACFENTTFAISKRACFIFTLYIAGLYYSMVFYVNLMELVLIQHMHDSVFNLDPQATDKAKKKK